jgi:DNA replication protein DnaC
MKVINIGKKFWDEDFTTFNAYTPELKRFFDICSAFVNDSSGRMLVMLGNHGNGKNHLAAAILKKMGGYMYSVVEMELLIRQTYTGKTSEHELYERLCNAPLLVINEIGRHKMGDWDQFFLSYIINKRYENMMPIILISNTHLKENCPNNGGCEKCFENFMSDDVISRIIECGEIMIFTGDDYRQKIREARRNRAMIVS